MHRGNASHHPRGLSGRDRRGNEVDDLGGMRADRYAPHRAHSAMLPQGVKVLGFVASKSSRSSWGVPSELGIESTGGVAYAKVKVRNGETVQAVVTR
jgi:hypothetical protein